MSNLINILIILILIYILIVLFEYYIPFFKYYVKLAIFGVFSLPIYNKDAKITRKWYGEQNNKM